VVADGSLYADNCCLTLTWDILAWSKVRKWLIKKIYTGYLGIFRKMNVA